MEKNNNFTAGIMREKIRNNKFGNAENPVLIIPGLQIWTSKMSFMANYDNYYVYMRLFGSTFKIYSYKTEVN